MKLLNNLQIDLMLRLQRQINTYGLIYMGTYLYMEAKMEDMQITLIQENGLNSYQYINRGAKMLVKCPECGNEFFRKKLMRVL